MTEQAPVSRVTRRWFAFSIAAFCLSTALFLSTGEAPNETYINAAFDLTKLVTLCYIGGSIADRADLLAKLGEAFTRKK